MSGRPAKRGLNHTASVSDWSPHPRDCGNRPIPAAVSKVITGVSFGLLPYPRPRRRSVAGLAVLSGSSQAPPTSDPLMHALISTLIPLEYATTERSPTAAFSERANMRSAQTSSPSESSGAVGEATSSIDITLAGTGLTRPSRTTGRVVALSMDVLSLDAYIDLGTGRGALPPARDLSVIVEVVHNIAVECAVVVGACATGALAPHTRTSNSTGRSWGCSMVEDGGDRPIVDGAITVEGDRNPCATHVVPARLDLVSSTHG